MNYHQTVNINTEESDIYSYYIPLKADIISDITSNDGNISFQVNDNNKFDFTIENDNQKKNLKFTGNKIRFYELFKRTPEGYSEVGKIGTKFSESGFTVTKKDSKRYEKQTIEKNRKYQKTKQVEIDIDEDDDEFDIDDDEFMENVDQDDDDDDENGEIDEREVQINNYIDNLEVTSLISGDIVFHPPPKNRYVIKTLNEYYSSRDTFTKKFKLYKDVDQVLLNNSNLFQKLMEFYNSVTSKELKNKIKIKIEQLHQQRKDELTELTSIYNSYHNELKELKSVIENYVKSATNS